MTTLRSWKKSWLPDNTQVICHEIQLRITLPIEADPFGAIRRAAGDGEVMNLYFSIALLPDFIVLLGVGGVALGTASALPAPGSCSGSAVAAWLGRAWRLASGWPSASEVR
jgi:hypothetical protein